MQEYYALLGISPTATTDEIERAYQDKKHEFVRVHSGQGPEDKMRAFAELEKLDRAYDDALAAMFAPIKVLQAPSPPSSSSPYQPASPSSSSPSSFQPPFRSSSGEELPAGLVEEPPVSFSDEMLLKADITRLRKSFVREPLWVSWGIGNRLLRRYVRAYVFFVLFDLIMKAMLGGQSALPVSDALTGRQMRQMERAVEALRNVEGHKETVDQLESLTREARVVIPPPDSALVSVLKSFLTTAYYFVCSLPMPFIVRFFITEQPVGGAMMRQGLYAFSVITALLLRSLTAWMLGSWAGASASLAFTATALCAMTIKYDDAS